MSGMAEDYPTHNPVALVETQERVLEVAQRRWTEQRNKDQTHG